MAAYRSARWRALGKVMAVVLPLGALTLAGYNLDWPPWAFLTPLGAMFVAGVGLGLVEGGRAADVYRCPACTKTLARELTTDCVDCGSPLGPDESHGMYASTRLCPGCQRRFRLNNGLWDIAKVFYCTHCGAWLRDHEGGH